MRQDCLGSALSKNAVSIAFDVAGVAAGFVPGGDGAVAVAQLYVGVGSTVNSASTYGGSARDKAGLGLNFGSLGTALVTPAAKATGVLAKSVPILGAVISAAGAINDGISVYNDYQACIARN